MGAHCLAQPGDGSAQIFHVPQALVIARDLAFLQAESEIPVRRTGDDGAAHKEHMVDRVKGMCTATPPHRHHCRTDLSPEQSIIGNAVGPARSRSAFISALTSVKSVGHCKN